MFNQTLSDAPIATSAPCRVDMGGTLDIATFHYPLRHLSPCTFNVALNLRTRVTLSAFDPGWVRIRSAGFETETHPAGQAPFDGPMGLMFAVAARFNADGVEIQIQSASPPRSALGGSSVAAVALIAAFRAAMERSGAGSGIDSAAALPPDTIALLAQDLEGAVAGVPCGVQDQLAAVYGGVHLWEWGKTGPLGPAFGRRAIIDASGAADLSRHLLVAYCGVPHESKDINGRWVREFKAGRHRDIWARIIGHTRAFADAVAAGDWPRAAAEMNAETDLRRRMTPDVLDPVGEGLCRAAAAAGCGARFTGAGGGGCLWAVGPADRIGQLAPEWAAIAGERPDGRLLASGIDMTGLRVEEGIPARAPSKSLKR